MAKTKKLYYLLLILPFLDVTTSLLTRYKDMIFTPGLIIKGILMLATFIYILFLTKSKYKKVAIIFTFLLLLYSIFYFGAKTECLSREFIFGEMTYLFKLYYFPVIFLGTLCYFDEYTFNKHEIVNILLKTLLIYILLLLIPILLDSANDTYFYGLKGTIGWFYSGNEVSVILIILLASLFLIIEEKKAVNLFVILPILYTLFNIGTKVSYLGTIIMGLLLLIFGFIINIKNNKITVLKYIIVFIMISMFSTKSVTIENNKYLFENQISSEEILNPIEIDDDSKIEVEMIKEQLNGFYNKNKFNLIFKKLLNSRDVYLANTISIYNNDNSNSKILYGMGFSNTQEVNNINISKLIEIDILDAFFHYGVMGLLIMIFPFLLIIYLILINRPKFNVRSFYYILVILLMCCVSTFSGHTLTSPAVAIYIILYLILFLTELQIIKQKERRGKL